ncbi:MAG TPA: methylmalonyl Co-A mutase-associated GTPase MeaB [Acidimicrobiales bacterium]|nr:methylmalonyl Co-A mutase-associated GTPase MeaB [Acidimicrobiales bacterium]
MRPDSDLPTLADAARRGDRAALARLLSTVERGGRPSQEVARLAYRGEVPYTVGITGAPGAGKSTLTGRLIPFVQQGWSTASASPDGPLPVAVLAVDPSSPFTGGAILADRVRMQDHATDPNVFIRSMATRGHLGGLALAVPDAVRLLGAAGLPSVLVETVGVGQMEVEVASATDTTVVVVTPGWGDSLQANKAGLLEVADLFVVNKADRPGAREARRDLDQMLDLSDLGEWRPPIVETVAATGQGVEELWSEMRRHRRFLEESGLLAARRAERLGGELRRVLAAVLDRRVEAIAATPRFAEAVAAIADRRIDPYSAAESLLGEGPAPAT